MYSTRLHVYRRASLADFLARILARKSARVGQVGGLVGEDTRACSARAAEQGSRRTLRHPRDNPRTEVGEDVCVGLGVRVGLMEFQLQATSIG